MPHSLIPFIDLKTQYQELKPQIQDRINRVLDHGQYIMGPEVKELEEKLSAYVGVKHCITASSGTDTLLIAMMALGIGPGDEVITTPFTFIATGEMVALLGAKPVFVDIDPRTYNMDADKLEAAVNRHTKAIMPVGLFGQVADMDAINAIAFRHRLHVIEDAAQSFGATYKGRKSCGLCQIGSTSFFPSKPLGAYGDGGALFTDDDALAKTMREIRIHGQDRRYHHSRIGINGRLDTLQAAIVLAKLERFPEEVERRQQVGARYTEMINSVAVSSKASVNEVGKDSGGYKSAPRHTPSVTAPYIESYCTSVFAQYTVRVDDRDSLARSFELAGIPTAVHYPKPLHLQPVFASLGYKEGDFPHAEEAANQVLSLPMGPDLTAQQQERIVERISAYFRDSQ